MTDQEVRDKVIVHDATLGQMNERLGAIERRLDGIEARLWQGVLGLGGFLAALMTVYKFV